LKREEKDVNNGGQERSNPGGGATNSESWKGKGRDGLKKKLRELEDLSEKPEERSKFHPRMN